MRNAHCQQLSCRAEVAILSNSTRGTSLVTVFILHYAEAETSAVRISDPSWKDYINVIRDHSSKSWVISHIGVHTSCSGLLSAVDSLPATDLRVARLQTLGLIRPAQPLAFPP
jgi:hypothetical protein